MERAPRRGHVVDVDGDVARVGPPFEVGERVEERRARPGECALQRPREDAVHRVVEGLPRIWTEGPEERREGAVAFAPGRAQLVGERSDVRRRELTEEDVPGQGEPEPGPEAGALQANGLPRRTEGPAGRVPQGALEGEVDTKTALVDEAPRVRPPRPECRAFGPAFGRRGRVGFGRRRAQFLSSAFPTIFSGLTHPSNCSPVTRPSARALSRRVSPFAWACFAIRAAAS